MVTTVVIIASNDNPDYLQYWPIVKKAWEKFSPAVPLLVHIGEDRHPEAEFNLKPIEGISTANLAKASRLLVAQSTALSGCRVALSDMDMIPLCRRYFDAHFGLIDDHHFFTLSGDSYLVKNFFPICYLVANQSVWREIVNPDGLGESELLSSWTPYNLCRDFFCDETLLKILLDRWDNHKRQLSASRGWSNGIMRWRADRKEWKLDKDILQRGEYVDAHMHPFGQCPDHQAIVEYVHS